MKERPYLVMLLDYATDQWDWRKCQSVQAESMQDAALAVVREKWKLILKQAPVTLYAYVGAQYGELVHKNGLPMLVQHFVLKVTPKEERQAC